MPNVIMARDHTVSVCVKWENKSELKSPKKGIYLYKRNLATKRC